MPSLLGKVAIITGSSRGIGRGIAERLGRDGASLLSLMQVIEIRRRKLFR
jgi:NAD(P)-dependent dehydrogenase (short-subunit alcohol dehydrogenase family)